MILRAGTDDAVITDFGISRLHGASPESGGRSNGSMEESVRLTVEGAIIGTPIYMAPEQLAGQADVGPAADVYAFGLVVREAATGRLVHEAKTIFALREARRSPPPPLHEERSDLPERFTRVIDRCLAPEPEQRFPSAVEVCKALEAARPAKPRSTAPPPPEPRASRSRARWAVSGLALAASALVAVVAIRTFGRSPPAPPPANAPAAASPAPPSTPPLSFVVEHRRRATFADGCEEYPVFAHDGKSVFYDGQVGRDTAIFQLPLPAGTPTRLTHASAEDIEPKLSPDGTALAFRRLEGKASMVETLELREGAVPRPIFPSAQSPAWSRDGRSLWVITNGHPVRVDVATGDVLEQLDGPHGYTGAQSVELEDGSLLVDFPRFFWTEASGVAVYSAQGRELRWLFHEDTDEVLAVTRDEKHVLIARAVESPSELVDLPLDGSPTTKLAPGTIVPGKGLSLSPDETEIAWSTCQGRTGFAKANAAGKLTPLDAGDWDESDLASIPGTDSYVALSKRGGPLDAWVIDSTGRELPRVLPSSAVADGRADGGLHDPLALAVSPDGKWLALAVTDEGIQLQPLDGSAPPHALTQQPHDTSPAFSRDGRELFFDRVHDDGTHEILWTTLDGADPTSLLGPTPAYSASASPIDDRVAYFAGPDQHTLVPMILDRATSKRAPLSPALGVGIYTAIHFTPDGKRVAVGEGPTGIVEIDLSTRGIVRRVKSDGDVLDFAYVGGQLMVVRSTWSGDIWLADLKRP